jgi:putative hydrolase of the HAD superfamily
MGARGWLAGVRAVVFDAVGTLIAPDPPAPAVYATVGRRHGSGPSLDEIAARFRTAFQAQDAADCAAGWRTDEPREERRWRAIVAATLDDVPDPAACFRELWDHFARPAAWRSAPGAGSLLTELARRGLTVGIASNFDRRLRSVVAALPELAPVRHVVISSEVGWRKPAREFFEAVVRAVGCAPGEVLVVGDDFENDYAGAMAAGLRAVLIDPARLPRTDVACAASLVELVGG